MTKQMTQLENESEGKEDQSIRHSRGTNMYAHSI